MSIVAYNQDTQESSVITIPTDKDGKILANVSEYFPEGNSLMRRQEVISAFTYGDMTLRKPRREFNDMAVIERMTIDQMAFNVYEPNNGDAPLADEVNSWRSRAVRPVVRNKIMSIAAHATARLIFPKIFAVNENSEEERDGAIVMEDLMEWSADQSDYSKTSLYAILTALWSPVSIVFTGFDEVYRTVRDKDENGKQIVKTVLDDVMSGFQDTVVPADELYIENFYENDIQKQSWLVWRRVINYDLAKSKYGKYDNFKYVKPGLQVLFNEPNVMFYEVYDSNMRQFDVEEVIYFNRKEDLMLILCNGVLLTDPNNPNPRNDHMYPFVSFGYELFDEGKCFYYKSLASKLGPDARVINTLYPMIIDGTYLNVMPPMIVRGGEIIGADVVVPGAVTTLSDKESNLQQINSSTNLTGGINTLELVENSLNESSQDPITSGQADNKSGTTAYEISRIEQNAATVLGLFVKMISQFVKGYGMLRIGDILQYMTIADVMEGIEKDSNDIVYKSFLLPDKVSESGTNKTRKIVFDDTMTNDKMSEAEMEEMSFHILDQEGGPDGKMEIWRANPVLFRNLKFYARLSPDVINPMSTDLERAFLLEEYDRAIQNPILDQEQVTRDFLLGAYPKSKKDPDKYMAKQQPMQDPMMQIPGQQSSPLQALGNAKGQSSSLPQEMGAGPLGPSL